LKRRLEMSCRGTCAASAACDCAKLTFGEGLALGVSTLWFSIGTAIDFEVAWTWFLVAHRCLLA
jgi:hypothetical protein